MKNATLTLTFVGAVLLGGLASAQSSTVERSALFEVPNVMANVTFYDGDPADGGVKLAEERINNSPLAMVFSGIEDTSHLTVEIDGQSYTVKTFPGGTNKSAIYMDVDGVEREDAVTLGEMLDQVAADPSVLEEVNVAADPSAVEEVN